ncbi:hypothetical protein Mal52_55160 [Symmachiella dynata]|uniref:Uncharacterized protein n=1 Tax=Symmachiella dynata TaxID=2527995 RepID=A0A517ZX12_9PLAN|nr:hypothetical protein Mal52_55160 [Symmachiella dynata]
MLRAKQPCEPFRCARLSRSFALPGRTNCDHSYSTRKKRRPFNSKRGRLPLGTMLISAWKF